MQVIAGEAPVRSRPRPEVHEIPGAELAPGAVVAAVDGAGRAELTPGSLLVFIEGTLQSRQL